MAMLRPDVYPRARRAVELDARLFPQGTEFLKSEYASQSTSMATTLQVIDEGGLEHDLNDILGHRTIGGEVISPRRPPPGFSRCLVASHSADSRLAITPVERDATERVAQNLPFKGT